MCTPLVSFPGAQNTWPGDEASTPSAESTFIWEFQNLERYESRGPSHSLAYAGTGGYGYRGPKPDYIIRATVHVGPVLIA